MVRLMPFALLLLVLVALASLTGCGVPDPAPPFEQEEPEAILCVVVDTSGSYADLLTKDGRAYRFLQALCDRFLGDRAGGHSRVIISQLSGRPDAVLWNGTPERLQQDFPDPESFRRWILARSDPSRSLVYHSINQSLEHLLRYPAVSEGRADTYLIVLSDLIDNDGNGPAAHARLMENLRRYAKLRSSVGVYWASDMLVEPWTQQLRACGFRPGHVEVVSEKVVDPPVPSFH
jgi:hypothetical protein